MTERSKANPSKTDSPQQRRWPKKMLMATMVVAVVLFLVRWQSDFLNERFNLDPGIANALTILVTLIAVMSWAIWFFFFAKQRWVGLLILIVPAILLTLYYPNFDGDINIVGWHARFWKSPVEYVAVNKNLGSSADLTRTTPHDFPQFLGVSRDSRVEGIELDRDWVKSPPRLLWKQTIGDGWSGFAAVNGFAVTQEQRGPEECVTCYVVETGELVWIHRSMRRYEDISAMGKIGPRATPTIDEGKVFVTSGTGVLDCLDGSNGELLWSHDVPKMVGIDPINHTNGLGLQYTMEDSHLNWGRAGSPLIYNNLVIVPAGGPNKDEKNQTSTLIAFDKNTGNEVWRGGQRMIAYGSPSLATVLGQPQIMLIAENVAVGHNPESGAELWSHEREGSSNANANCSQVTFVSNSQLLLSKGYNLGGELIELSRKNDAIQVTSVHKDTRILKTKLTNPVIDRGYAYSLSDGYLECIELESFRRQWKQRGRFGNGQLLLVGGNLLVHTESGKLILIAADPTAYQEFGSVKTIDGTCWNTLCLSGNRLLVRSELEAACFMLPTASGTRDSQ